MKVKKIKLVIIFLIVIGIGIGFFIYKTIANKNDKVLNLKTTNKEMYAIYINNGDGEYIEQNSWPGVDYIYNSEKSGCVDENGNIIPGALKYKNHNALVETDQTSFCYLYFDKKDTNASMKILVHDLFIAAADTPDLTHITEAKLYAADGTTGKDFESTKSDGYHDLAALTLTPLKEGEDNNVYTCKTTLKITLDKEGQYNMLNDLKKGDVIFHTFINGHNTDYDLSEIRDEGGSKTIDIEIETVGSNTKNIRGYVEYNYSEYNKKYLDGKYLHVPLDVGNVSCTKTGKAVEADKEKVKNYISNNTSAKGILFVNFINENGANIQDLSKAQDESIKGWIENDIICIGSKNKIIIKDMSNLISNNNVNSIELSNITFDRTTSLKSTFADAKMLANILFPDNIDTSKVTDMSYTFSSNIYLAKLDLSNFDTSRVTDMEGMFELDNITLLDLSNFDTTNVKRMYHMFNGYFRYLDLSSFNFQKVGTNDIFNKSGIVNVIVKNAEQRGYLLNGQPGGGVIIDTADKRG